MTIRYPTLAIPTLASPTNPLFDALIKLKAQGHDIILWTCRKDIQLQQAVDWCKELGLEFDAINENPDYVGWKSRKVVADMYIDDRAFNLEDYKRYIL